MDALLELSRCVTMEFSGDLEITATHCATATQTLMCLAGRSDARAS